MTQTAVEFLLEQMGLEQLTFPKAIIDTAKEMEKKQIMNAYDEGRNYGFKSNGEEYYNETFKSK